MTQKAKIELRISIEDKKTIKKRAAYYGFTSMSEYIRVISTKGTLTIGELNGK